MFFMMILHLKNCIKFNLLIYIYYIYTVGKISIEHVTIFLSKYISKGAVDLKFSPNAGNNPSNP